MKSLDSQRRKSNLPIQQEKLADSGIDGSTQHSDYDLNAKKLKCSVQEKVITIFLDAMLDAIVESWESLPMSSEFNMDQIASEIILGSKANIGPNNDQSLGKQLTSKQSLFSKEAFIKSSSDTSLKRCSELVMEERALIHFRNGNTYKGHLHMKSMHGEGRFQWANGTVYEGHFKNNEIKGRGCIHWKNENWYEGDFLGNLRHGSGLYVDSRLQRAYFGDWYCAMKHGKGTIYYDHTFKNSYEGDWRKNIRQGFGTREYSPTSGYEGQWKLSLREGIGLLIWPNHDIYKGLWKDGLMYGDGTYIWNAFYNDTLCLPSINVYRGQWQRGERNGYGSMNLGLDICGYYKGEFKNNLKHGMGRYVANNGMILEGKTLFKDDDLAPAEQPDSETMILNEALEFNISDVTVHLVYHIERAFKDLEKHEDEDILKDYLENNQLIILDELKNDIKFNLDNTVRGEEIPDIIEFEQSSLRKALQHHEKDLKNIYYKYARMFNNAEVEFQPILIRLFLWQMYFDCRIRNKGLTLVDIDRLLHQNPEWLTGSAHNPFEKIYFWQFLHSVISVARKLYAKKYLPKYKPDTLLASAFRKFMDEDILPGVFQGTGKLQSGYRDCVALKSLYSLYRSIGEPHSIRAFVCAARHPAHREMSPMLLNALDHSTSIGRNVYEFEDEATFVTENSVSDNEFAKGCDLKLFNFSNLSSRAIIQIFSHMYPQIVDRDKVLDLSLEITFYEFYEALILCGEESIRLDELSSKDGSSSPTLSK